MPAEAANAPSFCADKVVTESGTHADGTALISSINNLSDSRHTWNAIVYTARLWPSCSSKHAPVSTSHSLQVMSKLAVAACLPKG